jgi:hypothetical protein
MSLRNAYSCRTVTTKGRLTLPGRETCEYGINAGDVLPATVERGTLRVRFEPHSTDATIDAEVALAISTIGDSLAFTIPSGLRWRYDLTGGESMCTQPLEDADGIAYPLSDAYEE